MEHISLQSMEYSFTQKVEYNSIQSMKHVWKKHTFPKPNIEYFNTATCALCREDVVGNFMLKHEEYIDNGKSNLFLENEQYRRKIEASKFFYCIQHLYLDPKDLSRVKQLSVTITKLLRLFQDEKGMFFCSSSCSELYDQKLWNKSL